MKTGTTFILSLTAILTLAAGSVLAYSGGSGTAGSPYQIATKADLLALAADTNDYNKCFILTADINMGGQSFTTAIIAANSSTAFTGTFDGNGHKIANFTIDGENNNYVGLFGQINSGSSVMNLGLENFVVVSGYYCGGLVGYNYGSISNCYSTGTVSEISYVGGLVGYNYGSISNCYSTGAVSGYYSVGGLVGPSEGNISNCYSTGAVSGSYSVGGLVGDNFGNGNIGSCYSTGAVSGSYSVGGLVATNNGSIENCYSRGTVSAASPISYEIGGLVGLNESSISKCYSTGTVNSGSGSYYVGGLLGCENGGSVVGCFWDINTSGKTTSSGGTGKTTTQMKTLSTFTSAGWDFTNETANGTSDYWRMCVDGVNYPQLNWEYAQYGDFACPDGVGMEDLSYFVGRWLESDCDPFSNNSCGGVDMDVSGTVNFEDFAIFAENWLTGE